MTTPLAAADSSLTWQCCVGAHSIAKRVSVCVCVCVCVCECVCLCEECEGTQYSQEGECMCVSACACVKSVCVCEECGGTQYMCVSAHLLL